MKRRRKIVPNNPTAYYVLLPGFLILAGYLFIGEYYSAFLAAGLVATLITTFLVTVYEPSGKFAEHAPVRQNPHKIRQQYMVLYDHRRLREVLTRVQARLSADPSAIGILLAAARGSTEISRIRHTVAPQEGGLVKHKIDRRIDCLIPPSVGKSTYAVVHYIGESVPVHDLEVEIDGMSVSPEPTSATSIALLLLLRVQLSDDLRKLGIFLRSRSDLAELTSDELFGRMVLVFDGVRSMKYVKVGDSFLSVFEILEIYALSEYGSQRLESVVVLLERIGEERPIWVRLTDTEKKSWKVGITYTVSQKLDHQTSWAERFRHIVGLNPAFVSERVDFVSESPNVYFRFGVPDGFYASRWSIGGDKSRLEEHWNPNPRKNVDVEICTMRSRNALEDKSKNFGSSSESEYARNPCSVEVTLEELPPGMLIWAFALLCVAIGALVVSSNGGAAAASVNGLLAILITIALTRIASPKFRNITTNALAGFVLAVTFSVYAMLRAISLAVGVDGRWYQLVSHGTSLFVGGVIMIVVGSMIARRMVRYGKRIVDLDEHRHSGT